MTDFPDLVLVQLFSFLSLKESRLLAAVNKHWRAVLQSCTKKRLCVCHPTCQFIELFEGQDVLSIDRKSDYAAIFLPTLKSGLTELSLFRSPVTADLQRELSFRPGDFARLKVLRIDGLQLNVPEFRLALPTLHTLCLKRISQRIVLNCSVLERLTIHNSRKQSIVIRPGETIKFLECQFLDENFRDLANLEHLIALRIETSLVQFEKLRKLEVYPFWQDFDRVTQVAREWLNSNKVHSNGILAQSSSNQSVLINGLDYPADGEVNMRLFDLYRAGYQGSEKSLLLGSLQNDHLRTNYAKLVRNRVSVPFEARLNYSSLIGKFPDRIPEGFFALFPNIKEIQVHQKVDTNDLLAFLRRAKTVRRLALFECEPEQRLLDGLRSVRSIGELKISEQNTRIRFEFLCGLQQLSSFSLHHFALPWQSVCRAFEACKYFDQFIFEDSSKENGFQLRKGEEEARFSLECFGKNETIEQTNLETIFYLLNQSGELNIV